MSEPNSSSTPALSSSPMPASTWDYYRSLPVPEAVRLKQRYWLHILLLLATAFTTLVVGSRMEFNFLHGLPPFTSGDEWLPFFPLGWVMQRPSRLMLGIPFSFSLLGILLAHEMGHYLFCRYYGVRATLPFFIPAPTMIGTLGAVIRIKAPIRTRAALFDIGIAGPIAGFAVAVTTLLVAMTLSKPLVGVGSADLRLGFPWIFYLTHDLLRTVAPGHPIAMLPLSRIYLHPTAVAAWVGMYATALNLLPSGQLDGGHIVYALAPRAHRAISMLTAAALVVMGWWSYGWWVWAAVIIVMNVLTYRTEQAPNYPMLPASRWGLGLLGFLLLALTITLSPIQILSR
ncbi:MAG TPA: site-2 protease family protein [Candidatus Solibacter sp.]|nr:site-2 protease family protein [Candidatus Solibacter sp.]